VLLDARPFIVLLVAWLTAASPAAFPQAPKAAAQDEIRLYDLLHDEDAAVRDEAEQALWALWNRSGDDGIDALMARAAQAMQERRYAPAIELLTVVVEKQPGYAEGWNRRATAYYLAGEYRKSIADCGEVLKRKPRHFGALSGLGQIYTLLEDYEEALKWFRRALEVNPNMAGVEFNIEAIQQRLAERRRRSI
jgi:tetratricopeptide (TPR) repeat protein